MALGVVRNVLSVLLTLLNTALTTCAVGAWLAHSCDNGCSPEPRRHSEITTSEFHQSSFSLRRRISGNKTCSRQHRQRQDADDPVTSSTAKCGTSSP